MAMATITVQRQSGTPLRCTAPAESLMADFPSLRQRYGSAAKLAKASERGERIVVAEPGENCEKYGSCGIMGSVALAGSRAARRPHRMSTPAPSRPSPPPPARSARPARPERLNNTSGAAGGACKCSTTTPAPLPPASVDLSDAEAVWNARADVRACFAGDRKSAWLRFHRDNNCNGRECLRQLGIDADTASPTEVLGAAERLWRDRSDLRNCFSKKQTWLTFHNDCARCGDDPLAKLGLRK